MTIQRDTAAALTSSALQKRLCAFRCHSERGCWCQAKEYGGRGMWTKRGAGRVCKVFRKHGAVWTDLYSAPSVPLPSTVQTLCDAVADGKGEEAAAAFCALADYLTDVCGLVVPEAAVST